MKNHLLLLSLLFSSSALAGDVPGLIESEVLALHHSRQMRIAVWYPSEETASEGFGDNPIFLGGAVRRNAAPEPGKHPIILLSHGMGGSYLSLNWLASGLAKHGAIVVSVNHPHGWVKDRDLIKMFNHWTRVQDLQAALNTVLADKILSAHVDPSRIYAAGFSFGGWTALSFAGVTADIQGNTAYCKNAGERSHGCTDLKTYGFAPMKADYVNWTASYKDVRIKAVAAIDPGLTWNLSAKNVNNVDPHKLLLIGLGSGLDRLYATDTSFRGSNFEALVPGAKVENLSPGSHFTAMPLCKPTGAAILVAEKDDPVCTDPQGTDRKAVHDKIIELISAHFGL